MTARARPRGDWRAYAGMLRTRLIGDLQYRAAAWAGVATQFAWGFMYIMLYQAFYRGSAADPGMPMEAMTSYIWLQQGLLALITLWSTDNDLLDSIQDGSVAYELCRPVGLYGFWFARLLGNRLARTAMRIWPIALFAMLMPAPYRLMLPPTWGAAGLFVVSVALSALLVVSVSMFIYILTFVTLSSRGTRILVGGTLDFFSGVMLPIPLMPLAMQRALSFLPFRYIADLPIRIYCGHIVGAEALWGIGIQAAWLLALIPLGGWLFGRALRRLVVQGG